jgi:hypothetical protein
MSIEKAHNFLGCQSEDATKKWQETSVGPSLKETCHHACHVLLVRPNRKIPSKKGLMRLARIRVNDFLQTLPLPVLQMVLARRNHIGGLKVTNVHNSNFHHSYT